MEKTLRVLGGGDGDEDSNHSHSHSHPHAVPAASTTTGVDFQSPQNSLRKRSSESDKTTETTLSTINQAVPPLGAGGPSKLSAYLNLFGDFVHNMWVFCPPQFLHSPNSVFRFQLQNRRIGVSALFIPRAQNGSWQDYLNNARSAWPHLFMHHHLSVPRRH